MDIVEHIYRAAIAPAAWPGTLRLLADLAESEGGVLRIAPQQGPSRWVSSDAAGETFAHRVREAEWRRPHERPDRWLRNGHAFHRDVDIYSSAELAADPMRRMLAGSGLGWEIGAALSLSTGSVACFAFERPFQDGPHSLMVRHRLNRVLPDLARAAGMAAHLGQEMAHSRVALLERLGLAALIVGRGGIVRAANARALAMEDVLIFAAQGRIALRHGPSNLRLREMLDLPERAASLAVPAAVPAAGARPPVVLHLLPVRRATWDVFAAGRMLLVVSRFAASESAPSSRAVAGLFDLTRAEAQLASALACGYSLSGAAELSGITVKSARTYLERVFDKTGTNQQGGLIALLKGASLSGLDLGD